MRVVVGADHAGYQLKEALKQALQEGGFEIEDVGTHGSESVDYPDFARKAAAVVRRGDAERGILVCGTGTGMMIAANKIKGIRAALSRDTMSARLSREHNDANVLALGAWFTPPEHAREIAEVWLTAEFSAGRHDRRVRKIEELEEKRA